jgi:hypothetical protein
MAKFTGYGTFATSVYTIVAQALSWSSRITDLCKLWLVIPSVAEVMKQAVQKFSGWLSKNGEENLGMWCTLVVICIMHADYLPRFLENQPETSVQCFASWLSMCKVMALTALLLITTMFRLQLCTWTTNSVPLQLSHFMKSCHTNCIQQGQIQEY